jgi:hypothetical protein
VRRNAETFSRHYVSGYRISAAKAAPESSIGFIETGARTMQIRILKRHRVLMTSAALALLCPVVGTAQDKTLASTIDVYVFPTEGQSTSQQSQDEAECYEWAVTNSGSDPFELGKQATADQQQAQAEKQAAQQAGRGAGARGAVGGAAAGALIGEIANDDASEGAAWGAAVGAVAARRRGRAAQQEAAGQAEQHAEASQQATAEQMANFKKAFSVCLEARKYMVKY